jgi:hypothetical protein
MEICPRISSDHFHKLPEKWNDNIGAPIGFQANSSTAATKKHFAFYLIKTVGWSSK